MRAASDSMRRFGDWLQSSKPEIKKRGKHLPVIGLLCLTAGCIAYYAMTGQLKNLCSLETLRPALSVGVLFGLCSYIIIGKAGLVFLKMLLCLGLIAWIIGWLTWEAPSPITVIGQLTGWGLMFAWVWSLEPTETQ
ncbi:MAG: hypothetical protein KA191_14905 [Verrucomicrobia bacterium]|jgi:hypothetical protein|nr:hypothetical protein [Verrucomicrobiota bacterium]OQC65398.1 MAG: hypothetical protein BWX48_02518 [Verrucomicrobia bacterium ADurb.Bin006]MDI9379816.1 hypothetical protein [Verrucomicrobiota bacterium]NMD20078.1 hypothetical protein [Verrucomicrobiota bacterium]HNU99383.1 hypothetical protein [Verrucomicrobiota bacterium]